MFLSFLFTLSYIPKRFVFRAQAELL